MHLKSVFFFFLLEAVAKNVLMNIFIEYSKIHARENLVLFFKYKNSDLLVQSNALRRAYDLNDVIPM